MAGFFERITVNPRQCGGRPCIRGMRIRVTDVLDLLAHGLNPEQIFEERPGLELEDISACLRFASSRLNHPVHPTSSSADADCEAIEKLVEDCQSETGIVDLAHEHDHYLYGKPKKG